MTDELNLGWRAPFPQEVIDAMARAIDNLTHTNTPPSLATLGDEMIPLGNWSDTIDDLESENEGLKDDLSSAENEIDELTRTVETLGDEKIELEEDVRALAILVEYWQEKAVGFEDELGKVRQESARYQFEVRDLAAENLQLRKELDESDQSHAEIDAIYHDLLDEVVDVRLRARSWFEVAKNLVRERNELEWENCDLADSYAQVGMSYMELKKALRTLSE